MGLVRGLLLVAYLGAWLVVLGNRAATDGHGITDRAWHLGDDPTADWPEAAAEPEGTRLDLEFEAPAFAGEGTLEVRQRSVGQAWYVELNGTRIATLERRADLVTRCYPIPAGALVEGRNTLSIHGDDPRDDITIGPLRWYGEDLRRHLDLRRVTVHVRDADSGEPLPARVTFVDAAGGRPELYYSERPRTAVRPGVCYTADGRAEVELPAGACTVYASRGLEWSLGRAGWSPGDPPLELELRRELDTSGFVACDTHVHTLTYSGHGDASIEERQVTLAAEGVELAVATDHNHNTDYVPVQRALGLSRWYTPVVGNEVTTPIGHLNGFPLDPAGEVPPYDLHDVVRIVEGIRARGAEVVILNHPRWPNHDEGPHGRIHLDPHTGEWSGPWACPFDAVELVNSDTEEETPMLLFRDWFALLNRGERLCAVGSSDSHAVGVVVGQGRTYVASSSDDPAALDLPECFANLASGRTSISMGIFADLRWRDGGGTAMGETLPFASHGQLELRVAAPSWGRPRRILLFADGEPLVELAVPLDEGAPTDRTWSLDLDLAWPAHDFWLVAVVTGEGVGGAWWPRRNDYTLAATNPVYFDVDGDGECTRPRELARQLLLRTGGDLERVRVALEGVDTAVAAHVLHLVREGYLEDARRRVLELGTSALDRHPGLREWLDRL